MTLNRSSFAALSGVALAVVAVSVLVSSSRAQVTTGPDYKVGQPPPGTFTTGQTPAMPTIGQPPMMIQGGGGAAAMVADGSHLYILQGNRLLKVKKSDLSIEVEKPLRPRGGFGAPGGPFGTTPGRPGGPVPPTPPSK